MNVINTHLPKRREIDVRKQHSMSLRETWDLCIRGVKHRLLRSMLTLAVVTLAVAFFMFLLSESMFQRSVAGGVSSEYEEVRFSQVTLTKLLIPATDAVSMRRLARALSLAESGDKADVVVGRQALAEAARISGFSEEATLKLSSMAAKELLYANWIAALPTGHRLNLVEKNLGRDAFDYILANRQKFHDLLAVKVEIRVPGKVEGFDAFLAEYPDYAKDLSRYTDAWNHAVSNANKLTLSAKGSDQITDQKWLISATAEATEAWRASIAALGFDLPSDKLSTIIAQLKEVDLCNAVLDKLADAKLRDDWARAFVETKRSTAEEKLRKLLDPKAIKLMESSFTVEQLKAVYDRQKRMARLTVLDRRLAPVTGTEPIALGLTGRQLFLLAISFLVCMVGIANAMLMSITERYREIATMKCLGATDGYILSQFMMEAALQGLFGGIIGVVIGFVISTLRSAILYGGHLWAYFPIGDVVLCGFFSLVAGIVLSAIASTQPSWSASRMAPMEAMRVE